MLELSVQGIFPTSESHEPTNPYSRCDVKSHHSAGDKSTIHTTTRDFLRLHHDFSPKSNITQEPFGAHMNRPSGPERRGCVSQDFPRLSNPSSISIVGVIDSSSCLFSKVSDEV